MDLQQERPTFFSRVPNLLSQNFGKRKVYRVFCQKVGEDQKKKGLPSDLVSAFCQKQDEEKKQKGLRSNLIVGV